MRHRPDPLGRCIGVEARIRCPHDAVVTIAGQPFCAFHEDAMRTAFRTGYIVYFVLKGSLVKIGITSDLETRVRAHRGELIGTEYGGRERERKLHLRFMHLHVRGEWFRLEGELRDYLRVRHGIEDHLATAGVDRG